MPPGSTDSYQSACQCTVWRRHAHNWYDIDKEQLLFQSAGGPQEQNLLGVALKENSVEFQHTALLFDVAECCWYKMK